MKLSVLIPARNEEFLQRTIDDVFAHSEGDIEILVALDNWEDELPVIQETERLKVITTKAGQRGATNALARMATGNYVMKLDAHCSMSQGFDVKMLEDTQDDAILVPSLGNLHAYDWVCPKGHRHFQGKYETCDQCGSTDLIKDIQWKIIAKPIMSSFYFDTSLHFQYCPIQSDKLVSETMSLQGSCFMISKERYFDLNICDEEFGSWGQQGTETSCKSWLSGGKVLSTKRAYYGHQFRETEGFPYLNPVEAIFHAQSKSREMFLGNKWPQQVRPIQWLIERFGYQGDWSPEKMNELCSMWTAGVDKNTGDTL